MKYLKLLFLFVVPFSIISCSDDDEADQPIDATTLIGTWDMTSLASVLALTTTLEGSEVTIGGISTGENIDFTITFTETEYTVNGTYDVVTVGTLNGEDVSTETESLEFMNESGSYTLNNNTIEFQNGVLTEDNTDFEIDDPGLEQLTVSITNNGQNLTLSQDVDTVTEEEGVPISFVFESDIQFTRQ